MEKTDARKLPLAALNERRRRAVRLREGGWKAVDIKHRGRKPGSGRQLSADQEKAIQGLICDKTPDQFKMAFALWNRQAVG